MKVIGGRGRWWRREVVEEGGGGRGRWWRREVVEEGGGGGGRWWKREVVEEGGAGEGRIIFSCLSALTMGEVVLTRAHQHRL
ncbi:hypothetical protein RRG08_065769 [Elysia crispata]|uniref:Uncharacterized protein n=1 Tax=Elysia crispata TaxID=231223 RepID=A0AAE0Y6B3_9GAST|nr:hypothetical protein RRG08_065769 [Elysia crispata]